MCKEGIVPVTGETWILQNSQKVKETSTPRWTNLGLDLIQSQHCSDHNGGGRKRASPPVPFPEGGFCVQCPLFRSRKNPARPFPPFFFFVLPLLFTSQSPSLVIRAFLSLFLSAHLSVSIAPTSSFLSSYLFPFLLTGHNVETKRILKYCCKTCTFWPSLLS